MATTMFLSGSLLIAALFCWLCEKAPQIARGLFVALCAVFISSWAVALWTGGVT